MKIVFVPLFFILITFFGCKKGDTGAKGATGATGSANVKYSGWAALNMTYSPSDSLYEQIIKADSLTAGILDSGMVLTYMKINSSGATTIVNADLYMDERFSEGFINLYAQIDFTGLSFRYILVPGANKVGKIMAGGFQGYSKDQLKAKSYEEIVKLLGGIP